MFLVVFVLDISWKSLIAIPCMISSKVIVLSASSLGLMVTRSKLFFRSGILPLNAPHDNVYVSRVFKSRWDEF